MTTATIPRLTEPPADTQVPDTLAGLDRDLFEKARTVLGYRGVTSALEHEKETRKTATARRQLYQRLIDMGVQPLDPAAVRRYKNKVEVLQWLKPFGVTVAAGAGVGVAIFAAAAIQSNVLSLIVGIGGVLASVLLGVGTWFAYAPPQWQWRLYSLSGYSEPVPQHVLATALQVVEGLSVKTADWQPWEPPRDGLLVEQYSYEKYVADPFLKIRLNGVEAYIAAWDEPSFQGLIDTSRWRNRPRVRARRGRKSAVTERTR